MIRRLYFLLLLLMGAPGMPLQAQSEQMGRYEVTLPGLPALEADVFEQDSQAALVPQDGYQVQGSDYLVQPLSGFLPRDVWLEKTHLWVAPVYTGSQAVGPQEIRLFELTGSVEIQTPGSESAKKELTSGEMIPDRTLVRVDSNSAAGVLVGKTLSLRLGPQTEIVIHSELSGRQRTTRLELKRGILFCKTLPGLESHDIQIQTPSGTALAHDGDFVVLASAKRMSVWTLEGDVELAVETGLVNTASTQDGRLPMVHLPLLEDQAERRKANSEMLSTVLPLLDDINRQTKTAIKQAAGAEGYWEYDTGRAAVLRSVRAFLPAHKTAEFGVGGAESE